MEKGLKKKLKELLLRCKSKEELISACENELGLMQDSFLITWELGNRKIYKSILLCKDKKTVFVEAKTNTRNGIVEYMKG